MDGSGILGPVPTDPRSAGLTYEPFYGLKEKPFSLTSDARFFYQSRSHAPAFDDLLHAIKRRESLTVLTGDIGTGKTTLCRAVLQSLDRKTFSAFVTDPFASREELLKVLLTDFGVASVDDLTSGRLRAASRTELSYLLYEFLSTLVPLQAFAVVFIDEAQNLSLPLLEEIRILSDSDGQLQVVLVGQLELRERLQLPQMRQLDQRVSVHCRLEPLDVAGVAGYISHRLHRAGGSADRVNFTGDAVEEIFERSGGVPRLINKLCDRGLYLGHLRRLGTIDADIVRTSSPDILPPRATPVVAPGPIAEPVVALPLASPPMPSPVLAPVAPAPTAPAPAAPAMPMPAATTPTMSTPAVPTPSIPTRAAVPTVGLEVPVDTMAVPEWEPVMFPAETPPPVMPASPSLPLSAFSPMAPPVTAPLDAGHDAGGQDSVDAWLAGIEDKAADAAKALAAAARQEAEVEEPEPWRARWAPNDSVSAPEPERPTRYRIRIRSGQQAAEQPSESHAGSRQFAAVLTTMIVVVLLAFAGPSIVRGTLRLASSLNGRFLPPPPPPVPPRAATRIAFPRAPQVPDGPY